MAKKIIAFYASSAQSGKSTAAEYLVSRKGYKLLKFAAPVKSMAWAFIRYFIPNDDVIWEHIEGDLKEVPIKGLGKSARFIMETIGHGWGRGTVDNEIWVNIANQTLSKTMSQEIVVDDLRYPNEFYWLRANGATIIKLVGDKTDDNPSSSHLDDYPFDSVILNNGTKDDLYRRLEMLLGEN